MIEAPHYSPAGAQARRRRSRCPARLFDGTVNEPVLHQAVKAYLNNQRQGTATDQDPELRLRRQPEAVEAEGHRPRAAGLDPRAALAGRRHRLRPDAARLPHRHPAKVRQLARKCALNARAREGAAARGRAVRRSTRRRPAQLAGAARQASASTAGRCWCSPTAPSRTSYLSGRNLPTVRVMPYAEASAYDILWSDAVVVEAGRARPGVDARVGRGRQRPKARGAKAAKPKAGEGAKPAAKATKKAAPKAKARQGRRPPRRRGEEAAAKPRSRRRRRRGSESMPALHRSRSSARSSPRRARPRTRTRKEYTFEVHPDANKHQIRDALEKLFGVKVTDVRTMQMRRHEVTRGRTRGTTAALEEGHRHAQGRRHDRHLRGLSMSIRQFQPMTAGTRFRSVSGFDEITRGDAGEVAARAAQEERAAATTTATSRCGAAAAGTSGSTASSTSSATSSGCRRTVARDRVRSEPLARASRWSCTPTARSATSCTRRG